MIRDVQLFANDRTTLVVTVKMDIVNPGLPEAVIWGSRVFISDPTYGSGVSYHEVIASVIKSEDVK